MIGLVVSILFFVAIGVYLIVRRTEMAHAMALVLGSGLVPGCAVALGTSFILIAVAAGVCAALGLFGPL